MWAERLADGGAADLLPRHVYGGEHGAADEDDLVGAAKQRGDRAHLAPGGAVGDGDQALTAFRGGLHPDTVDDGVDGQGVHVVHDDAAVRLGARVQRHARASTR
ncbi:hypothetical protein AB0B66_40630 [Catellatospora sp. NPDC049111]|uniref:hypothetical protein n=1 Tax=Catellatospora sp. NPDC049111 TaxID=3155271 RepID=UPI0033F2EAA7